MATIRWNPLDISTILRDDLDIPTLPILSRFGQGLNLYETENEIVAEMAMPGVKENQIDISIEDSIVRVTGTIVQNEEERSKRQYYMSSLSTTYNYSFRLPEGVKKESEQATLEDGILILSFPKVQKIPPKKVKVTRKSSTPKKTEAE